MWITALILGFAGSMHCLGMCTPLLMAVTSMKPAALFNRVIYNTGRILTYGILGAMVASAGIVLPFHDYQNLISILLGISLLIVGLSGIKSVSVRFFTSFIHRLTGQLKNMFGHYLKEKKPGTMFILGALNGLLPCGLTAIALTWCLTLQGPLDGFNFMLLFGAGTLPVMLGLAGALPLLAKKFRFNAGRLTTSMLVLSGVLLIVRVLVIHLHDPTHTSIVEIIMCR